VATPTPVRTATPTAVPVKPAGSRTIFLDPGHGGADPGAVHTAADGTADLLEKDLNLDVAKRLGALLTAGGYKVVYARTTDAPAPGAPEGNTRSAIRADMQARVDLADAVGADLFISIHHNGFGDPSAAGTETYYCEDRPFFEKSKFLAQLALDSLIKELANIGYTAYNRGIHDDFGVLRTGFHYFVLGPTAARPTDMPAIIGEALFVTNNADAAILKSDSGRQAIARGYYQAIRAYFLAVTLPAGSPVAAVATPSGQPSPGEGTPPPELARGDPARKRVALTFDAGAGAAPAAETLDMLKAAGVHSTMFLTGDWIRDHPDLARRVAAEGHEVGNHTVNHPDLRTLTDAQIGDELSQAAVIYHDVTGGFMVPYFRPPLGARDARVLRAAWQIGYRSIYWTVDSGDWRADATDAGVEQLVVDKAVNGAIVVMHLGSAYTPHALPHIIAALRGAGNDLVTVSALLH
jgi:N-acetylmuramoyl-L-alanine amidase/peptidoglycan/xylan/chitin deacetylase (PgdA/CDA1 family)